MQDVIDIVKRRMKTTNWQSAGNCYEASVAAGMLLSINSEVNVRLINGTIRRINHWWLTVDNVVCDPTADQFNPLPTADEYARGRPNGIDLYNLACWVGLTGIK